jgi:hypothetical protein
MNFQTGNGLPIVRLSMGVQHDVNFLSWLLQFPAEGGIESMANVSSIVRQLKAERDHVAKQLSGMDAALRAFANVYGRINRPGRKTRKLSAASRAKIAAAQKRRWAKVRAKQKS